MTIAYNVTYSSALMYIKENYVKDESGSYTKNGVTVTEKDLSQLTLLILGMTDDGCVMNNIKAMMMYFKA